MNAPAGFKATWARIAREPAEPAALRDLLALVGYDASAEAIAGWPMERRVEAEAYATNVHLRASDNVLRRHPRPSWLPEPWGGSSEGEGIFEGPGGTPIGAAT